MRIVNRIRNSSLFLTGVCALLASCSTSEHSTLTSNEKKDGWELLFDGKSLNGWHIYNKGNRPTAWKVSDGELWVDTKTKSKDRADLTSNADFKNFDLKFEWKIAKGGNSGVIFNVQEQSKYPATFLTGPEYQILDDVNSAVHVGNPFQTAGALYNVVKTNGAAKPKKFGDWNESRIVQRDGKITFWLNGKVTVTANMNNDEWKQAIGKSNMRFYPDFGKFTNGKITLQDHNDPVYFRDIKIKRL